jgi:Tol biopolymer transport system component
MAGLLAFVAQTPTTQDAQIFRIDRSGASLRSLRTPNGPINVPVWSPDGASIAFEATLGFPCSGPCYAVQTMKASGGTFLATLASGGEDPLTLDPNGWQPMR